MSVVWLSLGIGALALAAIALLAPPLMRRRKGARDGASEEIYRDQLAEVGRDHEAGLIGESEARAAKAEIARRMLRAAAEREATEGARGDEAAPIPAPIAIGFTAIVPLAAVLVYLLFGSPDLPDQPLAARQSAPAAVQANAEADAEQVEMTVMIDRLAERLQAEPDDLTGWIMLARSLNVVGRQDEFVDAYARAVSIAGADVTPVLLTDYAEAMVVAAEGEVMPPAIAILERSFEADRAAPKTRYYIALAAMQQQRPDATIAILDPALAEAPADAPYLPALRGLRDEASRRLATSQQLAVPPAPSPAPPDAPAAPGGQGGAIAGDAQPSAEARRAASEMTVEERQAFIRSMVDRLASRLEDEPGDLDGWIRLVRAYGVLGDTAAARAAIDTAEGHVREALAGSPPGGSAADALTVRLETLEQLRSELP